MKSDLEQQKADLDRFGYCYIENALPPDQLEATRRRLEEQAAAELELGHAYEDAGEGGAGINQRLWFLLNKGKPFRDLLKHDRARALVGHLLGEDYLLSSFTANIARKGGIVEAHTDQWWMPWPVLPERRSVAPGSMTRELARGGNMDPDAPGHMISPAVACNVVWMLTDFTEENGATLVVPGSHLSGRQPVWEKDKDAGWVPMTGKAGAAAVIDGRIWHSTGRNLGSADRVAALTYFTAPQFRTQENIAVGVAQEILDDADDDLRALMGFQVWNGYGRIENPKDSWITRGQRSLGELRPSRFK